MIVVKWQEKYAHRQTKKEERNSFCFGYLCVWLCLLLCVCTVILPEQKEQKVSIVYVFLLFLLINLLCHYFTCRVPLCVVIMVILGCHACILTRALKDKKKDVNGNTKDNKSHNKNMSRINIIQYKKVLFDIQRVKMTKNNNRLPVCIHQLKNSQKKYFEFLCHVVGVVSFLCFLYIFFVNPRKHPSWPVMFPLRTKCTTRGLEQQQCTNI